MSDPTDTLFLILTNLSIWTGCRETSNARKPRQISRWNDDIQKKKRNYNPVIDGGAYQNF